MKDKKNGFTLIEVIIAVVVLSIMILVVLGVFNTSLDVCSVGSANLMAQTLNTNSMAEMTREIRHGKIISASAASLMLQVPVDWDLDGDVLDATGAIEWGGELVRSFQQYPNDPLNGYLRYTYEEARTFVERDEGRNGIDLNENNSTNDTFGLGHIVREVISNDGVTVLSRRQITPDSIVMTPGIPGGDVDGDGVADPLFVRLNDQGQADSAGPSVRISFFSFRTANKERTILLHVASLVAPEAF